MEVWKIFYSPDGIAGEKFRMTVVGCENCAYIGIKRTCQCVDTNKVSWMCFSPNPGKHFHNIVQFSSRFWIFRRKPPSNHIYKKDFSRVQSLTCEVVSSSKAARWLSNHSPGNCCNYVGSLHWILFQQTHFAPGDTLKWKKNAIWRRFWYKKLRIRFSP